MTARLDLSAPATVTVLASQPTLSSLAGLPGGITVSDPTGGTVTVELIAGNSEAGMSASAISGATVAGDANTLYITGTALQVNAALAALEIDEPSGVTSDLITILATDSASLSAQSAFAVSLVADQAPAFVNPGTLVTLHPNRPLALPDFLLSDPTAQALAAMGLGTEETLQLTLSVAEGVLLLPGYSALSGIAATGVGTGTIELSLTANEIGALNSLLGNLQFAGPSLASGQHLFYALWNLDGVLAREATYGSIYLNTTGQVAASASYSLGSEALITGDETVSGTLSVGNTLSLLGNLDGEGAVSVGAGAVLEMPYNSALLGGTSYDFGQIAAVDLLESGQMLVGNALSLSGELMLGAAALMDFAGLLQVDTGGLNDYQEGMSLGTGAVLTGGGTLAVGDFAETGMIDGSGTILALDGETLQIDAGMISAGIDLQVDGGGAMVLGPVSSLYGIFNTTPLTIQSGVTLQFENAGAAALTGGYADPLGGTGGAFVISGPEDFSGTVAGFAVGDELIFPGLSGLDVLDVNTVIGSTSFVVSGVDDSGVTEVYTIYADIPTGLIPAAGTDAAGDPVVLLHAGLGSITNATGFAATAGTAQPLLGLSLVLASATTKSLTLTISSAHGSLSTGSGSLAARLTLTAANIATMNAELAGLSYTGTGALDVLTISSGTGILAGIESLIGISRGATGQVDGYSGLAFTVPEFVSFGSSGGLYIDSTPHALGGLVVTGLVAFDDVLLAAGYSGTGLLVDAGGNVAFDAAASVVLAAAVTIGDYTGPGGLEVLTDSAAVRGNITLASSNVAAGSSLLVAGSLSVSGAILVGQAGAATLFAEGSLVAASVSVASAGTLLGFGQGMSELGGLLNTGQSTLQGTAQLSLSGGYIGTGSLQLAGETRLTAAGLWEELSGGAVEIGVGASLVAGTLVQAGGTLLDAGMLESSGTADLGNISLQGGSIVVSTLIETGTLIGYGVVDAATLSDNAAIEALGGRLLLAGGSLANLSFLGLGAGSTLELSSIDNADAPVSFNGTAALLLLDNVGAGFAGVVGLSSYDAVDLVGTAPSLVSFASGEVTVLDTLGGTVTSFGLQTSGTALPAVSIVSDGQDGALITLGDELPCFARGSQILTPAGYRAVEDLRPGDPVVTAAGERRPVRWVGWRTLDLGPRAARFARPVIILPDAFGPGRPLRRLALSPTHCVFIDGVLIPVTHLVNDATILRDPAAPAMTYYHVELDRHDLLVAEGLACESFFCAGNRGQLYHELGRRSPARRPFAPTVTAGPRLAAARRLLHGLALAAGFSPGFIPRLRGVAGAGDVLPELRVQGRWRIARFVFPEPQPGMTLLCATACPSDTDPDSEDRRELGLCLGELPGLRFGEGWLARAAGDAGVWMGRQARLSWAVPQAEICLPIAAIVQSWQRPLAAGAGKTTQPLLTPIDAPCLSG